MILGHSVYLITSKLKAVLKDKLVMECTYFRKGNVSASDTGVKDVMCYKYCLFIL
jgi:hypothetical protein